MHKEQDTNQIVMIKLLPNDTFQPSRSPPRSSTHFLCLLALNGHGNNPPDRLRR